MSAGASGSLWASRALAPEGPGAGAWLERARVRYENGCIVDLVGGVDPQPGDERFDDATLVPGLVDLQVNGANRAAFDDPAREQWERAIAFHLASGTTSLLATLISAPLEHLEAATRRLAAEVDAAGPLIGIHLEGPFLSEHKSGAHSASHLLDPTPEAVDRLLAAAGDGLRMITLAPERVGALDAVERLAKSGAVVAAGHSLASLAHLRQAVDRGLSFVTHVGNASEWPTRPYDPQLGYRRSEPGLVGAFMIEERLRGSVILDGRHLHPELVRALLALRGDALVLVSDATPAAGLPPGRYRMGGLDAQLHAGGYATANGGLAGSTIPLLTAVHTAVGQARIPLDTALRMASEWPARIIGAKQKGRLAAGADADLLLLGPDLTARAVLRGGEHVRSEGAHAASSS